MKTSFTALDTYGVCPLKYKFQEIEKLETPKRIDAVFGTLIHSALKYMFEASPLFPAEDEVVNFFSSKWNDRRGTVVWSDESRKEKEEKLYYEEGVKLLRNFYQKNQPWRFNPVALESRFWLELPDDKTGETHTIAGVIDRIDKNLTDDSFELIDYKTGKRLPSQDMVNENLQLGLYELALVDRWPEAGKKTIHASLFFLKHNEKITAAPTESKEERRARTRQTILEKIREIEMRKEKGDFPPQPGPLCDYCGFRAMCPMWSHEYKKKEGATEEELKKAVEQFFESKKEESGLKEKISAARDIILEYMERENVGRVFGDAGFLTKTVTEKRSFDLEKATPLLEKAGLIQKILEPDEKKLAEIYETLPQDVKESLSVAIKQKKTTMLKATKKTGSEDDSAE